MASVFDGMASALNAVFGAPVTWTPEGGVATQVQAVFREEPVSIPAEDGSDTLVEVPSLRVQLPLAATMARGDQIAPGNGKTYRLGTAHTTGSPASDAFILFELESLT